MSQLPAIPTAQAAKTLAQPTATSGSEAPAAAAFAGEPVVDAAFLQAMQEVLESSESDPLAVLGWTVALPLQPEMNPLSVPGGKLMPDLSTAGGSALPLPFRPGQPPQPGVFKPALLPELKSGLLVEQLTGQADRSSVAAMLSPSTDGMLRLFESSAGGELSSPFSLAGLAALQSPGAGRTGQLALAIDVPVGQAGWDKAVGERIQWMVGRNIQNAEVKLTPPHLGPLEIRISVHNDQASVSFVAAQLPTREALEAAIPRLREMFGEANLSLADVDVGQGGGSDSYQPQGQTGPGNLPAGNGLRSSTLPDPQGARLSRLVSNGLVDDYA